MDSTFFLSFFLLCLSVCLSLCLSLLCTPFELLVDRVPLLSCLPCLRLPSAIEQRDDSFITWFSDLAFAHWLLLFVALYCSPLLCYIFSCLCFVRAVWWGVFPPGCLHHHHPPFIPPLLGAPVAYADIYDLCPDILPLSYHGGSLVRWLLALPAIAILALSGVEIGHISMVHRHVSHRVILLGDEHGPPVGTACPFVYYIFVTCISHT